MIYNPRALPDNINVWQYSDLRRATPVYHMSGPDTRHWRPTEQGPADLANLTLNQLTLYCLFYKPTFTFFNKFLVTFGLVVLQLHADRRIDRF